MTPLMLLACAGGEPDILAEPSAESGGQMRALSATPPATNPRTVSGPASRGGTRATTPAATPPTGVTIPAQTASTWRVRLAGNAAAGTGARVEVRLNGVEIARGDISHASPFEYTLTTPALLPGATLDISLTNATAADGTPLRWLWVDYIALPNLTIRPSDANVVFDAGDGAAAYDGQDLSRPGERMTRNGALRFTIPAGTVAAAQVTPQAAGVYIDAQRGHDANDGSFASPWQSFRYVSTVSLPAWHGIYLRCDSAFADAVELTAAQIKDNTQIAGYGPECVTRKATITGADRFAGDWTKTGQMWSRALPANTAKISQLFINGKPQRVAQWPNSGPTASMDGTASALTNQPSNAEAGTAASKAGSAQVQIQATDAGTLASKDLIGATAQLRTQPWLIETRKLKAGTGSQLQLDRATDWPLPPGQPFLLQDKFWMLDSPGEFFHDTQAQRLYLMAPAEWAHSDLNALVVEGTTRDVALSVTGPSGVQIRDLALVAAATTGLALHNAPQAKVERIEARDNAVNGVRISQWPRLTASLAPAAASVVSDSLVQGNGLYGIDASQAEHTQVLRNRVLDTGVAAHQQAGVMAAIANGVGGRTDDNEIVGSAYLGIRFSSLRASQVQRNTISSYCLRLSDCGGIYTWTARAWGRSPAAQLSRATACWQSLLALSQATKPWQISRPAFTSMTVLTASRFRTTWSRTLRRVFWCTTPPGPRCMATACG